MLDCWSWCHFKMCENIFTKILNIYQGILKYCYEFSSPHLLSDNEGFGIEQLKSPAEYIPQ